METARNGDNRDISIEVNWEPLDKYDTFTINFLKPRRLVIYLFAIAN